MVGVNTTNNTITNFSARDTSTGVSNDTNITSHNENTTLGNSTYTGTSIATNANESETMSSKKTIVPTATTTTSDYTQSTAHMDTTISELVSVSTTTFGDTIISEPVSLFTTTYDGTTTPVIISTSTYTYDSTKTSEPVITSAFPLATSTPVPIYTSTGTPGITATSKPFSISTTRPCGMTTLVPTSASTSDSHSTTTVEPLVSSTITDDLDATSTAGLGVSSTTTLGKPVDITTSIDTTTSVDTPNSIHDITSSTITIFLNEIATTTGPSSFVDMTSTPINNDTGAVYTTTVFIDVTNSASPSTNFTQTATIENNTSLSVIPSTPAPFTKPDVRVTFTGRIQIPLSEFDSVAQHEYIVGIAKELSVNPSMVRVVRFKSTITTRRILSTGISVVTVVLSSVDELKNIIDILTLGTFTLFIGASSVQLNVYDVSSHDINIQKTTTPKNSNTQELGVSTTPTAISRGTGRFDIIVVLVTLCFFALCVVLPLAIFVSLRNQVARLDTTDVEDCHNVSVEEDGPSRESPHILVDQQSLSVPPPRRFAILTPKQTIE